MMWPWHSRTLAARWCTGPTKDRACQHSVLDLGMLTVSPPHLELTSSVLLGLLWETIQNELWRPHIKEQLLSSSGCFQDKGNTWHFQATLWADLVNSLHTKESSGAAELKARWRRLRTCVWLDPAASERLESSGMLWDPNLDGGLPPWACSPTFSKRMLSENLPFPVSLSDLTRDGTKFPG